MTEATSKDYWISPSALYVELNALGNPDYIQASCVGGAQILVYVNGVISYDAGHNYRRWSLQASPTIFNTHTLKYVYAAIPRDSNSAKPARIVFPSEELDIYGKNVVEKQIGSTDYYYIFLQGVISSSGDNGTKNRDWTQRISTGYLSSDEAINARTTESEWYKYSSVDKITTFLKDLTMEAGTKFYNLYAKALKIVSGGSITFEGQDEVITGIVKDTTDLSSVSDIVTPKYLDDSALSKKHDDVTEFGLTAHEITAMQGFFSLLNSPDYNSTEQTGYGFYKKANGKYGLNITDLLVWGKAIFTNLEIRNLYAVGGNVVLSPTASKIFKVVDYYEEDTDGTKRKTGWKCYLLADDGTTATTNLWQVYDQARCQTFNIAEGEYENVSNKDYWRMVSAVSTDDERECLYDESGNVLYDGRKFAWIVLSNSNCMEGSDEPAADDTIVQMGNQQDTDRQSLLMLCTTGDDAPMMAAYQGVHSYSLENTTVFKLSGKGVEMHSNYYQLLGPNNQKIYSENYRGNWESTSVYYYYDKVTHRGTEWLCLADEKTGTTTEPSPTNDLWRPMTAVLYEKLNIELNGQETLDWGESITATCTITLGDETVDTSTGWEWSVERDSGNATEDAAWNAGSKATNFKGVITLSFSSECNDLGEEYTGVYGTVFTFKAWRTGDKGNAVSNTLSI